MVVITGKFKGKRLKSVDDGSMRPTLARVKESLFSILQWQIEGKRCLDVFAGSGALGIELLSRGAEEVIFIDNKNSRLIAENLANCKVNAKIMNTDYAVALQRLYGTRYDIVLADPPFNFTDEYKFFDLLKELKLVDKDSVIAFEHLAKRKLNVPDGFELFDSRKYGTVSLSFVRLL